MAAPTSAACTTCWSPWLRLFVALVPAAAAAATIFLNSRRRPRVSSLHIYPVKGCRGISLLSAQLNEYGFVGDREWMIVRASGERTGAMCTPRELPRMAMISPSVSVNAAGGRLITLTMEGHGLVTLPADGGATSELMTVTVWDDTMQATVLPESRAWLNTALGRDLVLVHVHPATHSRALHKTGRYIAWPEFENPPVDAAIQSGAFSDGYPLLLASTSSIGELNSRLAARSQAQVPIARFRPNIVVSGLRPFEEDLLETVRLGAATVLHLVKPCSRCTVPAVDPASGVKSETLEPLVTLETFRAAPGTRDVFFGQNAVHTAPGCTVTVGDELTVLRARAGVPYEGPEAARTMIPFLPSE